jgi:hypothetical protein
MNFEIFTFSASLHLGLIMIFFVLQSVNKGMDEAAK